MNKRQQEILSIIQSNKQIGISAILSLLSDKVSIPTLNRDLSKLKTENYIYVVGKGPSLQYTINLDGLRLAEINLEDYFKTDIDERIVIEKFNRNIFNVLKKESLFTVSEIKILSDATKIYRQKIKQLSKVVYLKEFERLMIELSWKSAQIEGNTYSLLDTEQLLKYDIASKLHTKEESIMLLNHKKAIEYSFNNADYYKEISKFKIIELHSLLIKNLGISKNLRKRLVRITGTKYLPADNEFIINEALEQMCNLINAKKNVHEKTILIILLISYIQPFEDANKRTARLSGNAVLQAHNCCPLSYRSVAPADYKKAMLLFYELNNITAFKNIYIEQYLFAIGNYF